MRSCNKPRNPFDSYRVSGLFDIPNDKTLKSLYNLLLLEPFDFSIDESRPIEGHFGNLVSGLEAMVEPDDTSGSWLSNRIDLDSRTGGAKTAHGVLVFYDNRELEAVGNAAMLCDRADGLSQQRGEGVPSEIWRRTIRLLRAFRYIVDWHRRGELQDSLTQDPDLLHRLLIAAFQIPQGAESPARVQEESRSAKELLDQPFGSTPLSDSAQAMLQVTANLLWLHCRYIEETTQEMGDAAAFNR